MGEHLTVPSNILDKNHLCMLSYACYELTLYKLPQVRLELAVTQKAAYHQSELFAIIP